MAVRDRLDDLRSGFPGCSIVAFADLSTGMVFAASTREKTTQEKLDALCAKARSALSGPISARLADQVFQDGDAPSQAVIFDTASMVCFLRSDTAANEALCLVCDHPAPVAAMMARGAEVLATLSAEG